jgi:DNA-binding IclR family transcriptional regulator
VFNLGKVDEQIVALLKNSESPLTLIEIAEKLGKPPKTIFRALQKLFTEGKIDCDIRTRRYTLKKE